jgi:hypothetical protein
VIRGEPTIGVQVMRIEETPLCRTCGDLAATLIRVPVLEREVEAVARRRFPVDPHDVVHLRVLGVLLRRVIELSLREGSIEVVRTREHVEQRLAVRVETVGGGDVSWKARWAAGHRIACPDRQRVPDVDQPPLTVEGLREIPLHLPIGRHRPVPDGTGPADQRSLQRVEEEQFLFASVQAWHRPAQIRAERVEPVSGLPDLRSLVEEAVRIERLMTHVIVDVPVIPRRAAFADDLDLSSTGATVLRPVGIQQYTNFGDRVEVDLLGHQAAVPDLVADHAVDDHIAPVTACPAHVWHRGAETHAEGVHGVLVANTGEQPHDRRDVAAQHLHLFDLRGGDDPAVLRLRGIHLCPSGQDEDRLTEAADFERQRAHRQPLAGAEHDARALECAKIFERGPDRVPARLQVGGLKVTLRVADDDP